MAHQQDPYGNPTHQTVMPGGQTDQHGNPVPQTGGIGAYGAGIGTGMQGGEQQQQQLQPGVIHRSGSSSGSSSEDDGQGGRRKKGIKEKIKEKLPGGGRKEGVGCKDEPKFTGATTTPGLPGQATTTPGQEQHHKGMMEKIKEKLPGNK